MTAATLTADGQIDLPKEIRARWGLRAGDRIALRLRADGVVEMEPETDELMSLCGSIKPEVRGVTIDEMNEVIQAAANEK